MNNLRLIRNSSYIPVPSPPHFQLLFLVIVTPIMHAFWDLPASSPEQLNDIINVSCLSGPEGEEVKFS